MYHRVNCVCCGRAVYFPFPVKRSKKCDACGTRRSDEDIDAARADNARCARQAGLGIKRNVAVKVVEEDKE